MIDKIIKPIYEFLVWDNCKNCCKFCFQRKNPRLFSLDQQNLILNEVIRFIESDNFKDGSNVLIVGGELFDDIRRKKMLIVFFQEIISKMISKKINILYINTNLIYDIYSLEIVKQIFFDAKNGDVLDRIHFTSSFDLEGRFKDDIDKQQFLKNIDDLSNLNGIKLIVNMILTNRMCNDIINKKFDIFNFIEQHNVDINLIPYIILDEKLAPTRTLLYETLINLYETNRQFMINQYNEWNLKQPRKMFYYDNGFFKSCECKIDKCGHSENFKLYSKKGSCFVCDVEKLFKQLEIS